MFHLFKANFLEELLVVTGLITIQGIYGFYSVFASHLMSIGIPNSFLIIYGNIATSILLLPLSFSFERQNWPKKFTLKIIRQLLLISFGGTMFQALMLMGIQKTAPAVASAMPNLAPGFIFLIAWSLGLEQVNLKCIYSKVKILGTLACIGGALAMSFFHGPQPSHSLLLLASLDKDKIIGCLCLIGAVFSLSCTSVLQAQVMVDFPAPMSLSAATAFIGAIFIGIVQSIQEHRLNFDWPTVNAQILMAAILMGGIVGGACTSFSIWSMKKRGPVFVSMFNPIGTLFSVIISWFTIGDAMTLGSLFGMLVMFSGLYFVLWAKKNEDLISIKKAEETSFDPERPLLS